MGKESKKRVCVYAQVELYLTPCDPMDCSPPGSSVHGILQAIILEWVALPSSTGSSRPRDQTRLLCLLHYQADSLLLNHQGKQLSTNRNSPKRGVSGLTSIQSHTRRTVLSTLQVPRQRLWSPSSVGWGDDSDERAVRIQKTSSYFIYSYSC